MNGWSNAATWTVAAWIDNDEALYRLMSLMAKRPAGPINDKAARRAWSAWAPEAAKRDLRPDFALVDWTEIAEHVKELAE